MSNIVNINDYRKEEVFLIELENGFKIGLTQRFKKEVNVKHLEFLHNLDIKTYFCDVVTSISSLDYYINSYESYIRLLRNYY